jgi:hypothetical protein
MQRRYMTFAQCLIEVIRDSEERTRALSTHDQEPRVSSSLTDGTKTVTFSSKVFTLILHRSTVGTWDYAWTWTDAL